MKKLLFMSILAVGALSAAIVPNLETSSCIAGGGPGGQDLCTYLYSATVGGETEVRSGDDFFTIYDFDGYVEDSATGPSPDWAVQVENVGLTPSMINIGDNDNSDVVNLTFMYQSGATLGTGPIPGFFTAQSIYSNQVTGWFSSENNKDGDLPGTPVQNVGNVLVPSPQAGEPGEVPEPMSMALLGGGLAALGLLPRRFKKS